MMDKTTDPSREELLRMSGLIFDSLKGHEYEDMASDKLAKIITAIGVRLHYDVHYVHGPVKNAINDMTEYLETVNFRDFEYREGEERLK